jgi:hypothetical protein
MVYTNVQPDTLWVVRRLNELISALYAEITCQCGVFPVTISA